MGDSPCTWRWDGIAWNNLVDECEYPATCTKPAADGNYAGQIQSLLCVSGDGN